VRRLLRCVAGEGKAGVQAGTHVTDDNPRANSLLVGGKDPVDASYLSMSSFISNHASWPCTTGDGPTI